MGAPWCPLPFRERSERWGPERVPGTFRMGGKERSCHLRCRVTAIGTAFGGRSVECSLVVGGPCSPQSEGPGLERRADDGQAAFTRAPRARAKHPRLHPLSLYTHTHECILSRRRQGRNEHVLGCPVCVCQYSPFTARPQQRLISRR